MHEEDVRYSGEGIEPEHPVVLPDELARYLANKPFACLTHPTDEGTVFVVKLPGREIATVRGRVPISLRHELYDCPSAPVIRLLTTVYDQIERPLKLESFINVGDPEQRVDYESLCRQDRWLLLFYDEELRHRLTKAVINSEQETMAAVLRQADNLLAGISAQRFDFDRAKASVMERIEL
jgi:hypothetical protein